MAAYVFTPVAVAGGVTVRFDTASGSTTPATIYPLDYAQPIPGALVRAHTTTGNLPRIESDTATLYQKTLDYKGTTVTATTTLTGTLQATGAPTPAFDASSLTSSFVSALMPEAYGAKGDVRHVTDAAITTGTALLSSTAAAFTSSDVGKLVAVEGAATASTSNPLGVLLTTISSVVERGRHPRGVRDRHRIRRELLVRHRRHDRPHRVLRGPVRRRHRRRPGRGYLRSQYATSSAVSDGGGDYQLYGAAMTSLWKMDTGAIPLGPSVQQFPYIAGACIVAFHTGQAAAITSSGNGQRVQWENIGIRFAKPFVSTGHGHQALGPLVVGQTYHRTSLVQSRFVNVAVFGHDGNSYALRHVNSYRCRYDRVMSSGGGCISNFADNASFVWNNNTIHRPRVARLHRRHGPRDGLDHQRTVRGRPARC
jgi:hypothetical protein